MYVLHGSDLDDLLNAVGYFGAADLAQLSQVLPLGLGGGQLAAEDV